MKGKYGKMGKHGAKSILGGTKGHFGSTGKGSHKGRKPKGY